MAGEAAQRDTGGSGCLWLCPSAGVGVRQNRQQEWFRIYLASRISFSMDVLASLHTTVLSTALLLCWPWWCSPAQASLDKRASKRLPTRAGTVPRVLVGVVRGSTAGQTPLGVLSSRVRYLSQWLCLSQPTHKHVLRDTRALLYVSPQSGAKHSLAPVMFHSLVPSTAVPQWFGEVWAL